MGSRKGADLDAVEKFMHELHAKHPDTVIVSGGAKGVDTTAERTWLELGGDVISYRPRQLSYEEYGTELWILGRNPRMFLLESEPTWADYESAAFYRNTLIAEECDRLVLFHKPFWPGGGGHTEELARLWGKPTHVYERRLA